MGETPHGSPHMGISPQARASRKEKRLCGKRNISCWGSCCFLSQTGSGPQKRLKALPFDPREPGAGSQALTDSSPESRPLGPQADLPFPDTEQTVQPDGLPQTPRHLRRDSVEQGPHYSPCLQAGLLLRTSERRGSGLPPPMYKGAGKSWEGSAATDTGLEGSLALELTLSHGSEPLHPGARGSNICQTEASTLAHIRLEKRYLMHY